MDKIITSFLIKELKHKNIKLTDLSELEVLRNKYRIALEMLNNAKEQLGSKYEI